MKTICLALLLLAGTLATHAQQVIPLYAGKAPGSESWTWPEKEVVDPQLGARVLFNVSTPTLTAYLPPPGTATGTAVVICPGGGFHVLAIDDEGTAVAKFLQAKGVAAFVLKYRLVHMAGENPLQQMATTLGDRAKMQAENAALVPLAVADGKKAMEYVRGHAQELGVQPNQIGLMGFSAGGTLALNVGLGYTAANRPDFLAPIYAYLGELEKKPLPADAPPLFVAAATDDRLVPGSQSSLIYDKWRAAGKPAELHLYAVGGHGFGMHQQGLPVDSWRDRFADWLKQQGFLNAQHLPPGLTQTMVDGYLKQREELLHTDWANLQRYAAANQRLPPPRPGERRVVVLGNSITENWAREDSAFFQRNHYVGRGISGQVSAQGLGRFRQDVLDLHPAAVVIMLGVNDIAEVAGPYQPAFTLGNLTSMTELAQANGIRVVLCSVTPVTRFPYQVVATPAAKVLALNQQLKAYAAQHHAVYLDYHAALADEQQGLKAAYTTDGLHPNLAGYRAMEPLLEQAVAAALRK